GEGGKSFLRAIRQLEHDPDQGFYAGALIGMALLKRRTGEDSAACRWARDAWKLATGWHHYIGTLFARAALAEVSLYCGDPASAERHFLDSLTHCRAANALSLELHLLPDFAELRRRQGDHAAAHELLREALDLAERTGIREDWANALNVLARVE